MGAFLYCIKFLSFLFLVPILKRRRSANEDPIGRELLYLIFHIPKIPPKHGRVVLPQVRSFKRRVGSRRAGKAEGETGQNKIT